MPKNRNLIKITLFFVMLLFFIKIAYAQNFLYVEDIKKGMKGFARSTFEGTRIEEFPVTVIGIAEKDEGGEDLILVKIDSGFVVDNDTGVIAGMSGSPVFIDNKLIGAISFSWNYSKSSIAGVTPIKTMLNEAPSISPLKGQSFKIKEPLEIDGKKFTEINISNDPIDKSGTINLQPVRTPLLVSGLHDRAIKFLEKQMPDTIILDTGTSSISKEKIKDFKLEPGCAIGLQLVSGDLNVGSAGTLTYIAGDKIYAFGHTFSQLGEVSFPMTSENVLCIISRYNSSFRLSVPIDNIGSFIYDRYWSVIGQLKKESPLVPYNFTLIDPENEVKKTYHLNIFKHPDFTPYLAAVATLELINTNSTLYKNATVKLDYNIKLENGKEIKLTDYICSKDPDLSSAQNMLELLDLFYLNDFTYLPVSEVSLTANITPLQKTATINKIKLNKSAYDCGDEMQMEVELLPYNKQPITKKFSIKIPPYTDKDKISVGVCGAIDYDRLIKRLEILDPIPQNAQQLYDYIQNRPKNNELIVKIIYPNKAANISSQVFPFFPANLQPFVDYYPQTDVYLQNSQDTIVTETDYIISNYDYFNVDLKVEEDSETEDKSTPVNLKKSRNFLEKNRIKMSEDGSDDGAIENNNNTKKEESQGKKEEATPEFAATAEGSKALPSGIMQWTQKSADDFRKGLFYDSGLSFDGAIVPGLYMKSIYQYKSNFVNAMVYDSKGDILYLGTIRMNGTILRIDKNGKELASIKLGDVENFYITSLGLDSSGNLYAGTAPGGDLYKINQAGIATKIFNGNCGYIWSIKPADDGSLWLGCGNPGVIYNITPDGKIIYSFDTKQGHIYSVAIAPNRSVYFCTQNNGKVYEISNKTVKELWECEYPVIEVAIDKDGTLYAGAVKYIFCRTADKKEKIINFPDNSVTNLVSTENGVYAFDIFKAEIINISQDSEKAYFLNKTDKDYHMIVGACPGPDGRFFVSTFNPQKIVIFDPKTEVSGEYYSSVFDSGMTSKWGKIACIKQGANISVGTRSGSDPEVNEHWSDWSVSSDPEKASNITSPPARYIQYKVSLNGSALSKNMSLGEISLFYKPYKQIPLITVDAPAGGEKWAGKQKISFLTENISRDTLYYNIEIKPFYSQKWEIVSESLQAKLPDIEKPSSKQKKYSVPWDEYSINTKDYKDGKYILRITAYDVTEPASNKTSVVSKPFYICNHEPSITINEKKLTGNTILIKGNVKSDTTNILEVRTTVNNNVYKAIAVDGFFDSMNEDFELYIPTGAKSLEIKVTDEAGNTNSIKI